MSSWFDDEKNKERASSESPVETPPAEPLITPPPAGSAARDDTTPAPPESAPPVMDGWQRLHTQTPVGGGTPPAEQTPPAAPYSWGNTYAVPQSTAAPQPEANSYQPPADPTPTNGGAGGYPPTGGGYSPYGWGAQTPPPTPPKKKRNKSNAIIAVLAVVCGATIITLSVLLALSMGNGGSGLPSTSGGGSTTSATENPNAPTLNFSDADIQDGGLTSKEVINKNLDSTVVISMYEQGQSGGFFGGGVSGEQQAGGATGIVMTADGYIITNWHCVVNEKTNRPYSRVEVTTYDGTVYESAEIVGYDKDTDLAVIKIKAANLQKAEFGDSSKLSMGDRVIALGNAGGLEWSASQGIVSGLARDVYEDTGYSIKCLQVDAAINPGNSGGPLLNNQGQVIGVNSAKIVASGYEGLGFSIPIKEAKVIIDDLLKYGYVKGRVMLGITGSEVTTPGYEGFMINSINEDSVLSGSKAQAGDIITHVNGTRVETYVAMRTELTKYKVGDKITLTLMRVDNRTSQKVSFNVECVLQESQGQ